MFVQRMLVAIVCLFTFTISQVDAQSHADHDHDKHVHFSVKSVKDGKWSDPKTWDTGKLPASGDRVLISRDTDVSYDVANDEVIRLLQVVGSLRFARDCDTLLNVAVLKVQDSDTCSESGFACDFPGTNSKGEPLSRRQKSLPTLEVGTLENPIPREHTARIRLHYLDGLDKKDAPALVCCSARMDLHGAPMNRTWVKLGANVAVDDATVSLNEPVTGWQVGDEVIVTGSEHQYAGDTFRDNKDDVSTEQRTITKIEGNKLHLDKPLKYKHFGTGEFRSEVANLSRNVIIESADPKGVRGHTMYHAFSQGSISYARFVHLGKEGELGRYSIHYHMVGDTMRGSQVLGVSMVDSHNRWVTIHGTEYLLVRDCVGYQSVGHGYFMEDGTEVYNLLDRNLGVQSYKGRRLPDQVLPFDPNDGAAFWWSNGRNTLVRNVACENDQYGYRYDSQKRSNFDSNIPVRMPDGKNHTVDIRTLPISRFSHNESHTEGLYSIAVAGTDGVGPDTDHPHHLSDLKLWQTHYALRVQLPTMLIENVQIDHAAYGIYRPWFENHVYRNLHIASTNTEPFNRGLDDESLQHGSLTVDGLTFSDYGYGGQMPLIQMSANNVTGKAESHFRNVKVNRKESGGNRKREGQWPLFNLGGGPRLEPTTEHGVPCYVHDYYGSGRHAKVVSTRAKDLLADGNDYRSEPPLTGDESKVAEVKDVEWPELLSDVDDHPPATIITLVSQGTDKNTLSVSGVAHDNGNIASVTVNGQRAVLTQAVEGVVDWQIEIDRPTNGKVIASTTDVAGNVEQTPHELEIR